MSDLILVVAAHPDDEILGCGGTMARHAAAGDEVRVIFMTDGVAARSAREGDTDARLRFEAARRAAEIVGARPPVVLGFPDNAMDSLSLLDVTKGLEVAVGGMDPKRVYTHHPADLNIDHRMTHEAVMTCYRPQPGAPAPDILLFEVPSSTGWASAAMRTPFEPRVWTDIGRSMERKLEALAAYSMEMREPPHARSMEAVETLAAFRGSQVGLEAAEAFDVARMVIR